MQSLKHIKAYLFLHGKNVSKKAVDKFLSILQADIKSGKITKAKDKFTKEVDRIQRSLVGMSNVMLPAEVAKVEIEAPRKKHYEKIVSGLGSIIPAMVSGADGKVTEAIILNLFKAKTGLSGIKDDEKKLRKSVKRKGIRLTHGYKLAKRKKGKKKTVKPIKKVAANKTKPVNKAKKVETNIKFDKDIVNIHNEIMKAGVTRSQAENILAYMGSIETIKSTPEKRLRKELVRIPGILDKTATKIIKYFSAEKKSKVSVPKVKTPKAPKSKVKASVTAAIADLLTLDKYQIYGAMFLGMFYSTFKNSDVVGDKIGDMKEKMFSKYEFDLFEHDYHAKTIELTEKGKELIKSIEGRIDTLKAKKSGTDMFPELAGTKKKRKPYGYHNHCSGPQKSARKQDGFVGVGTISETVDGVLAAMKAERSGVKKVATKKHNTHLLPVYRKVEVMPVENVSVPAQTQVQTSTVKTEGTMSGAEMGSMTFEKLNFNDYYKGIFGSPATNFDMCIDGSPGSGKTTFLLMFANYLADFHGPTLFVTTEEFGSATLIDKVNRFNIKSKNLYFAKKVPSFDELKKYKFVFIDSINHAKITIEQYQAMREKAAKTAFILVLQQTKSGSYKGSTDWPHEVEITMSLFKDEFDERNLKISKDRYTDPVPRVVKI